MEIKSKFNIGDRVWCITRANYEITVLSDYVDGFYLDRDRKLTIYLRDCDSLDMPEEELVAYDDTEGLLEKIQKMDEMNSKEWENRVK